MVLSDDDIRIALKKPPKWVTQSTLKMKSFDKNQHVFYLLHLKTPQGISIKDLQRVPQDQKIKNILKTLKTLTRPLQLHPPLGNEEEEERKEKKILTENINVKGPRI